MSSSLIDHPGLRISVASRHPPGAKPVSVFEAGRDTKDVLRAIVRMSPLPMVLTDPHQPDDPLVYANHAFLQLTGYSESEVLGRNCRFLQGKRTDPEAVTFLSKSVRTNAEAQVDLWNYRKDGTALLEHHVHRPGLR